VNAGGPKERFDPRGLQTGGLQLKPWKDMGNNFYHLWGKAS